MARHWLLRLDDMLKAIEHIETIESNSAKSEAILSRLALERAFEILSEASRYLPADIKAGHGDIRWQDLADLGNIIRHVYERVSIERLRETARRDVPALKRLLIEIKAGHGRTG